MQSQVLAAMAVQLRLGKTNMASVAQALKMSEATLRRRLLQEQTSFSKLYEEARFVLAKKYLADRTLELLDVANLMGFRTVAELRDVVSAWSNGASLESYREPAAQPASAQPVVLDPTPSAPVSSAAESTPEPKPARHRDPSGSVETTLRDSWA